MNRNCQICGGTGWIYKPRKTVLLGTPVIVHCSERCLCNPEKRGTEQPAQRDGRKAAAGRE